MTQVDFQSARGRRRSRQQRRRASTIIIAPILFTTPLTTDEALAALQLSVDAIQVTADIINTRVIPTIKAKYVSPI